MPSCFFSGKKINVHSVGALDEGFLALKAPKAPKAPKALKDPKVPKDLKDLKALKDPKDLKEKFFTKIFAGKIKKFKICRSNQQYYKFCLT